MPSWPIHAAKARLSARVKQAQRHPQQLTSHGQPVTVVLSAEAFVQTQQSGESLVSFIRRSPLMNSGDLVCERDQDLSRKVAL